MRTRTLFGKPLGLALILIQKSVWGACLVAASVALFILHAEHVAHPLRALFAQELAEDPHDLLANVLIRLVPTISLHAELLLAIGAAIYALLEAIEVWGLWRNVLWVEMLVIVETGALLPYELWEIVLRPSPFKAASLLINALIVWYLAVRYLRQREAHRAERPERSRLEAEQQHVAG